MRERFKLVEAKKYMPDIDERLKSLENAKREIQDSLIVISHLEARQSRLLKEQSEYLASHELRLQQSEERNRAVDERIEKLVSASGVLISRPQ